MSDSVFEVTTDTAVLKILDKEYVGRFPLRHEQKAFLVKLNEAKAEDAAGITEEFFASLGFPAEAIDTLNANAFRKFLEFLIGGKKN